VCGIVTESDVGHPGGDGECELDGDLDCDSDCDPDSDPDFDTDTEGKQARQDKTRQGEILPDGQETPISLR
jgi:hypothetical protein